MPKLDEATKALLRTEWLPRVRALKEDRKPFRRLMVLILILPIVFVLAVASYQILFSAVDLVKMGLCGSLLGLSAVAFVYLGRLQSCDDDLMAVEFAVIVGDWNRLVIAVGLLSCLGKMRDLLSDVKRFVPQDREQE